MNRVPTFCAAALLVASASASAAEYVYSKKRGSSAIGIVDLHQVNSETVNYAPLCGQYLARVAVKRVSFEGSVLQSFEGTEGSATHLFSVEDFYDKFPNATRAQFKDFIKQGATLLVVYQECGRSPVKHPLTVLLGQ